MSGSRIVWRRVSRGLTFIGFGVAFLLSAQNLLHTGFWLAADGAGGQRPAGRSLESRRQGGIGRPERATQTGGSRGPCEWTFGAARLTLRLGVPSTDTRLYLEGAFNNLELVIPEDSPVRISTDGFLNVVDRRDGTDTPTGPAYRLLADGAFNRVVIRSD